MTVVTLMTVFSNRSLVLLNLLGGPDAEQHRVFAKKFKNIKIVLVPN